MKKHFETESKRILDLMINSIYTNKEIFIRELISNASDAIDKRYFGILNSKENFDKKDFEIRIDVDKENRTIKISDNGIGMNEEDLEKNLGTIAKSGSLDFKTENKDDEISIIGQFGVGFYSAFMVAEKIVVNTLKNGFEPLLWTSEGLDGYEIKKSTKENVGTEIELFIKKDEDLDEFLNQAFIKHLVKKYSNYIKYPIRMEVSKSKLVEGKDDEYEDYIDDETINSMIPIWNKSKVNVTDDEYKNFYHAQRYGFDDPLAWIHLSAEGVINYKAILYIPSQKPMQYYTSNFSGGLELYSNGVMIMEKNEELLPDYLSFVKGIVDSEDISLNISREMLQNDRRILSISKNLEKKVLAELRSILSNDKENYKKFFKEFGLSIKAGIYESHGEKGEDLKDLLIFRNSQNEDLITFSDYIELGIKDNVIYYATGNSAEYLDKMPIIKSFKDREIPVIYLTEQIDEFVIKILDSYKENKFKSVFDEDFEDNLDKSERDIANEKSLIEKMKKYLHDEVVDVKISNRLDEDASFLTARGDISIEMEKTFSMNSEMPGLKAQKVLEINPKHPLYTKLMNALSSNDEKQIENITKVLYAQARLVTGLNVEDIIEYTRLVNSLIK